MRILAETNVLVSARFWKGNEFQFLDLVRSGHVFLVTSEQILGELERILLQRFNVDFEKCRDYLNMIRGLAEIFTPVTIERVIISDSDDDHLFAAAVMGKANIIVTGDKAVLAVNVYRGIPIMTVAEVIKIILNIKADNCIEDTEED